MEFVETTFERPTDFDCLFEPQSLDQVSLDIYEDRSSSSFYSSHSSVSKTEVCNIVEQSNVHFAQSTSEVLHWQKQPSLWNNLPDNILERLGELENALQSLQQENNKLKMNVADHESNLNDQLSYIYSLEQNLSRLDQYGRRENIELLGIPSSIKDHALETEVLKILNIIGLDHLDHYGIVACHRIGKRDIHGNRSTIVRFLNRKDAVMALKCKRYLFRGKELGYHNLQIVENLCPSYQSIFDDMKELKAKGKIQKVWTFNGLINYKNNPYIKDLD